MSSKPSGTIAMLAGGIAGASETVITYPAEFLKTRRQLPASSTGRPSSSIAIFRSVFNSQGIRGIYAGSPALIASNTAKGGVRFFSFESSKQVLERTIGSNNVFVNILAGLSGGIAESILVVTPAEVLKTQSIDMAAAGSRTTSTLTVARQVIRLHGPLGLWRGITPTLCKQATNSAVRFASFGAIKDWISTTSLAKRLNSAGLTLLAGSLSGAVTTYVIVLLLKWSLADKFFQLRFNAFRQHQDQNAKYREHTSEYVGMWSFHASTRRNQGVLEGNDPTTCQVDGKQ